MSIVTQRSNDESLNGVIELRSRPESAARSLLGREELRWYWRYSKVSHQDSVQERIPSCFSSPRKSGSWHLKPSARSACLGETFDHFPRQLRTNTPSLRLHSDISISVVSRVSMQEQNIRRSNSSRAASQHDSPLTAMTQNSLLESMCDPEAS